MNVNLEKVDALKHGGYDHVYVWNAVPNEEDPDHSHSFDTHLEVLERGIEIKMNNKIISMKSADTVDISRNVIHCGKASAEGCLYIVAEKH